MNTLARECRLQRYRKRRCEMFDEVEEFYRRRVEYDERRKKWEIEMLEQKQKEREVQRLQMTSARLCIFDLFNEDFLGWNNYKVRDVVKRLIDSIPCFPLLKTIIDTIIMPYVGSLWDGPDCVFALCQQLPHPENYLTEMFVLTNRRTFTPFWRCPSCNIRYEQCSSCRLPDAWEYNRSDLRHAHGFEGWTYKMSCTSRSCSHNTVF